MDNLDPGDIDFIIEQYTNVNGNVGISDVILDIFHKNTIVDIYNNIQISNIMILNNKKKK